MSMTNLGYWLVAIWIVVLVALAIFFKRRGETNAVAGLLSSVGVQLLVGGGFIFYIFYTCSKMRW
jgi:hypothetical protein